MTMTTDYEKLKRSLLKSGSLWEDAEFAAVQTSVFYHQTPPFSFVWRRPHELVPEPVFLPENPAESFDLTPGKLGDRWLLSTLGVLSVARGLFFRAVPADQSFERDEYCGLFRFRIFWFSEWREVLVDDRLPTVNGKLVFMHARGQSGAGGGHVSGRHFWAALLEKAYAKLYGSYEALKYTNSLDALADLTGAVGESIHIPLNPTGTAPLISKLLSMSSIVTAVNHSGTSEVGADPEKRPNGKSGSPACCPQAPNPKRSSSGGSSSGASSGSDLSAGGAAPVEQQHRKRDAHERVSARRGSSQAKGSDSKADSILPDMNYRLMVIERVVLEGGESVQLVKLRTPLTLAAHAASREDSAQSKGSEVAWSRHSRDWDRVPPAELERIKYAFTGENDFWMSYAVAVHRFTHLELLHLESELARDEPSLRSKPNSGNTHSSEQGTWHGRHWRGVWRRGVTAGGCRNHGDSFPINTQLCFALGDSSADVILSLAQDSVLEPKVIGFSLYALPSASFATLDTKLDRGFFRRTRPLISSPYVNAKEVSLRIPGLEAGSYVLVPTTYEPGQEGPYAVRFLVGSSGSGSTAGTAVPKLKPLDCIASILKPAIVRAPSSFDAKFVQYEALFLQIADEHKSVNAFELQELLEACLPNDYVKSCATLDVARLIISSVSLDSCMDLGRLKFLDFKNIMCSLRYWQSTFKVHTKGTSGILRAEKLREALYDVGFQLNSDILSSLVLRYIRKDGTLRFGDFVSCVLHLAICFAIFDKRDPNETGTIKMSLADWIRHSLRS